MKIRILLIILVVITGFATYLFFSRSNPHSTYKAQYDAVLPHCRRVGELVGSEYLNQ